MGMTIDLAMNNLSEILTEATEDENSVCYVTDVDKPTLQVAIDTMRKHQMFQADYEARLKADMVAMLTEIQLEIEETVKEEEPIDKKWANGLHYSEKIIQQKINALKTDRSEEE